MTTLDKIKRTAAVLLTLNQKSVESGKDVAPSALVFMANNSVGLGKPNFDDKRGGWLHAARKSCEAGVVAVLIITDNYLGDPNTGERNGMKSLTATILQNGHIASVGVLIYTRRSQGHIEWKPLEWDDTTNRHYLTSQNKDDN